MMRSTAAIATLGLAVGLVGPIGAARADTPPVAAPGACAEPVAAHAAKRLERRTGAPPTLPEALFDPRADGIGPDAGFAVEPTFAGPGPGADPGGSEGGVVGEVGGGVGGLLPGLDAGPLLEPVLGTTDSLLGGGEPSE